MTKPAKQSGQLRIIGGEWRGRKLSFPALNGLRPTADRVRETLFNWLQMDVPGARCLDLFAGSGALGLEALSRGAAQVMMVEQNRLAVEQIRQHLNTLGCDKARVQQTDALQFLQGPASRYDVVFLDPPYALGCLADCAQTLEDNDWLNPDARIYLEDSSQNPAPALPPNWQLIRQKKAGEIGYYLAQRQESPE